MTLKIKKIAALPRTYSKIVSLKHVLLRAKNFIWAVN
jgi:hypothetical protein